MKNLLRQRILTKIAQTQTDTSETTIKNLPASKPLPGNLWSILGNGYKNKTAAQDLYKVSDLLNKGLHYSSLGKSSFQDVVQNNNTSGMSDVAMKIIEIIKYFNSTLLNNLNPIVSVNTDMVNNSVDALISKVNSIPQINPTGQLAQNISSDNRPGDLKTKIISHLRRVKEAYPRT